MQFIQGQGVQNGMGEMLGESIGQSIWRRRNSVAAAILVCIAVGLLYLLKATPTYTVCGQLYVERRIGEHEGDRPQEYLHAQVAVLRSTAVLRPALERISVGRLPELTGKAKPLDGLRERLKADVNRQDGLVMLALECSDPTAGAYLLNTIIQVYMERQSEPGVLPRAANVGVIEAADAATTSVRPRRAQVIGLCGVMGLAFGVGWAVIRGRIDPHGDGEEARDESLGSLG
ncbi:MAG: hypothetical protein ACM359_15555 [Bacillota bacterium]